MAIRKTETSENRPKLSDNFDSFQSLIDANREKNILDFIRMLQLKWLWKLRYRSFLSYRIWNSDSESVGQLSRVAKFDQINRILVFKISIITVEINFVHLKLFENIKIYPYLVVVPPIYFLFQEGKIDGDQKNRIVRKLSDSIAWTVDF